MAFPPAGGPSLGSITSSPIASTDAATTPVLTSSPISTVDATSNTVLTSITSSPVSSVTSTSNTVTTTIFSSSTPSASATSTHSSFHLTTIEIVEVALGSAALCLLLALILFYVLVLRRRQKYQRPDDRFKNADSLDSPRGVSMSKSYQDGWHPYSGYEGNVLLFTSHTKNLRRSSTSDSQYYKDPLPSPFVTDYEGLVHHETHAVPLNGAQSRGDTGPYRWPQTAAFLSTRPSSSNASAELPPLSIPERPLNHSNRKRSMKRKDSRRSSRSIDSDDSASLYSEASASTPYASKPFQETNVPPLISPGFTSPTHSPPTISLSAPPPLLRLDEDEAEGDETEVYNVAKLIHSRLQRAPDPPSRNSSIVSHIERSGSIKPVLPVYHHHLKPPRNTTNS